MDSAIHLSYNRPQKNTSHPYISVWRLFYSLIIIHPWYAHRYYALRIAKFGKWKLKIFERILPIHMHAWSICSINYCTSIANTYMWWSSIENKACSCMHFEVWILLTNWVIMIWRCHVVKFSRTKFETISRMSHDVFVGWLHS